MNRLVFSFPLFILAFGCGPVTAESVACQASLNGLNRTEVEQIVFARDVDGHDGYSFIAPNCDFFVPLSIVPMPEAERVKLNMEVRRLIQQDSGARGFGFFDASCDCRYDDDAKTVIASSVTDLTLNEDRFVSSRER